MAQAIKEHTGVDIEGMDEEQLDAHTRCGGHAVFEGAYKVGVDNHCFVVAFLGQTHLFDEASVSAA